MKPNNPEDIIKSPVTQVSDKCYLDTFSKHEKINEENYKKSISDHHFIQDSLKFEAKHFSITDKFNHTRDFSEKSLTKIEKNFSEPKKSKRERNIKSPKIIKSNFDEGMNLNSFSSRTIEESHSSKQIFLDNKVHMNKGNNKLYKIDKNPVLRTSNKHIKAAFKNYSKHENLLAKKNTSQEKEKLEITKNANSQSEITNSLNKNNKNLSIPKAEEESKEKSISSVSTVKTFQSSHQKINKNEVLTKTKTVKEYELKDQE